MKKIALALVAGTIAAGAASAHNISTGFYAGAAVGYGSTTVKANPNFNRTAITNIDAGSDNANIGIHAGYGWVSGCTYFGGEIGYTFENSKINLTFYDRANSGGSLQLKRTGHANVALRAGYLFTPSTMMYLRLGGNWGKFKTSGTLRTTGTDTAFPGGSKSPFSFAPGVGMETAIHRNVYLRGEYTYEFAKTLGVKIRPQFFKLGLSYKF